MKLYYLLACSALAAVFASCAQQDEPLSGSGGAPLNMKFDFSDAGVVVEPSATRATATTVPINEGTTFIVRAYTASTSTLVDDGHYKVVKEAATGKMVSQPTDDKNPLSLSSGTYDFFFISYHSSDASLPAVQADGTVAVENGKDFITTSIRSIKIQTNYVGQDEMTIPMAEYPFTHLCTRVKATLEIPDVQVVNPTAIENLKVEVSNLPQNGTFAFPGTSFTGYGNRAETNKINLFAWTDKKTITAADASTGFLAKYSSADGFVLPLDDASPLKFKVTMKIHYTKEDNSAGVKEFVQPLELAKALLPGKSYNFVFTLSFYGDYTPTDLALDIQEFTPVDLTPGGAGGDE